MRELKPVSNNGHRERLRERFRKSGIESLQNYEVIEFMLSLCIHRKDVKPIAKLLIQRFGNLKAVLDAPAEELGKIPGIGLSSISSLQFIREFITLYLKQEAEETIVLNNSDKLERFWISRLSALPYEVFEVAYLDNRYQLLKDGVERLEEGVNNQAVVYPRKVMRSALKQSASAIVVAHNHPSGIAEPSSEDIQLTRALVGAGLTLNVEVIDHLIIAGKEVFSFRRMGLIV